MKKKILLAILTLVFSASVAVGAATAFASGGVSALAEGGSTKFRDPLNNGRMTAVDDEVGKTAIDLKAADLQASISRALYTGKVDISKTFEMEITLDKMNADGGIFVSFLSTADDFPMAGYGDGFAINFWDETAWGHPQSTWLRADPITYSKAGEENLQAQWRVCSDESTQYIGTTFYMRVWDFTDTQLAVKIKWGDSYDDNRTIKKSDLPEGFDYTDCNLLIAPFVDMNHTTYADDMKVTVDVYEQYNVTCGSTGNGSVTASAQGVVKERQEVTFTANPQEGYQVKEATLNGTHVDLLPDNTYKTTVTGDIAFHVEFEEIPVYYTVTATAGDNGRVEASAQGSVRENSEVVFTVYPEEGYRIKQATVNGEPIEMQGTVYTTTVTGDIAFHVEFEEIPPEVITHTVTVQTEGNGRVEATAQGTVEEGTVVTFTAIPDEGNRVQQATVNGSPVELTAQLTHEETVNGDITFKVVFEEIPITYFNVSATAGEGGEVTADHEGQVPSGTEVTFTVKPALSHKIGTATVNGDPVDVVDGTYTVTVSDDVEFHVDFAAYSVDPATKFTDGLNNGRVDAVLDGEDVRLSLAVSDGQKSISRAVYTQPVSLEYFEMSFTIENLSLYGGFRISFLTQPGDYPMEGYGDGFCIHFWDETAWNYEQFTSLRADYAAFKKLPGADGKNVFKVSAIRGSNYLNKKYVLVIKKFKENSLSAAVKYNGENVTIGEVDLSLFGEFDYKNCYLHITPEKDDSRPVSYAEDVVLTVGDFVLTPAEIPPVDPDDPDDPGTDEPDPDEVYIAYYDGESCIRIAYADKGGAFKEYVPVKEGYKFLGWYLDEELTEEYVYGPAEANVTVYAKWESLGEEAACSGGLGGCFLPVAAAAFAAAFAGRKKH